MSSRLSLALSEFAESRWATEPRIDPPLHPTELDLIQNTRSSRVKRASLILARFLVTFGIGIAATLAWQSYGDIARETIANLSPHLGWLAPRAAPAGQAASAPAANVSLDQLVAISRGLAVVRQSVDKLAADITRLQATKQDTPNRPSAPPPATVGAPARKPVPPGSPSQAQFVR
jgi:hypothetical protein